MAIFKSLYFYVAFFISVIGLFMLLSLWSSTEAEQVNIEIVPMSALSFDTEVWSECTMETWEDGELIESKPCPIECHTCQEL